VVAAAWIVGAAAFGQEPAAAEADYLIGVEDRLTVAVWREPDLSRIVTVRPDGKISFPLIGDVQAAGRTPRALGEQVGAALARYVKEPVVTVLVEEINNFKVYVLGEVNQQGALQLRQRTRLLQALALAGGLTQYADRSNVVVVREEAGREVRLKVDYRRLVSGDRPDLNHWLKPGDTVIVN
jgi:polysaccharide export outer membrane protein